MKKELAIIVLASWVGLIWCNQVPERPAYNFGETYRVYGDTKECIEGSSGTKCHWYQTQYFQMLTNRTLRIDTNVKKFYESFFYRPSNNGFFRVNNIYIFYRKADNQFITMQRGYIKQYVPYFLYHV